MTIKISNLLEHEAHPYPAKNAESVVPKRSGYYSIFIDESASFPAPFDLMLHNRNTNLIYIGTASKSLYKRLVRQDLRHIGPSTFFRAIGPILGFRPPRGSLLNKKNQRNYKFSQQDTRAIIAWINDHLSIRWVEIDTRSFPSAEITAIRRLRPILNTTYNPNPSHELAALRAECRKIAYATQNITTPDSFTVGNLSTLDNKSDNVLSKLHGNNFGDRILKSGGSMEEIQFGENKVLYGVIVKPDGSLKVNVYHENQYWRYLISANRDKPQYFLKLKDFSGTNPRAKYWLSKVVKAYSGRFSTGRVEFYLK